MKRISLAVFTAVLVFATNAFALTAEENCSANSNNCIQKGDVYYAVNDQGKMTIYGPTEGEGVSVGYGAFANMDTINKIEITGKITSIQGKAFQGVANVTELTIPDSVISIGSDAFRNMTALKSLIIGDNVSMLGNACNGVQLSSFEGGATTLQEFLATYGKFEDGNFNVRCTSGDCKAVLEAWDRARGTTYASRMQDPPVQVVNEDGSISTYINGKLVSTKGRRIYTVEQAERVTKPTGNKFKVRYR